MESTLGLLVALSVARSAGARERSLMVPHADLSVAMCMLKKSLSTEGLIGGVNSDVIDD